ncbi:MAG: hypothetical protein JETT_3044 [Candidatus Jettenia ecosi]|uniref:Uncharacterized protein n=1 Tax=Candidatus Jettenia ecosi TaxID=2494326 RepID=A0A533Q7V8_9BACT|nr:MAG: hypothetical protein JETT_3044 [Candidatus Jettenia ecosi]
MATFYSIFARGRGEPCVRQMGDKQKRFELRRARANTRFAPTQKNIDIP